MKCVSLIPATAAAALVGMSVPCDGLAEPQRDTRSAPTIVGSPRLPLIVIDPGHGGADPGAVASDSGLREKDVTLDIAKAVRDALVASGRARVALTRDDDRFLALRERYGIARRMGAALFISVHCDSGDPASSGATVYTLSEVASDRQAARLAARENKADFIRGANPPGDGADILSMLVDLSQRETVNNSASFARALRGEASSLMNNKPTFHRMAWLTVLRAADVPSVLFETGYITNQSDADFLTSRDGRKSVAESISRAVGVYFARTKAKAP